MGIPSYYRTLIQRLPHAIQRKVPSSAAAVNTLVVDMNCMIYHVLKEPKMEATPYPGEVGKLGWERKLQTEVCLYLTHIWKEAGAPVQTYVALDGVVPYAKIKQQRFRRFKGGALAQGATGQGAAESIDGVWGMGASAPWDKNAITPGTAFMETMGSMLRETGKKHGWLISDTNEPGEGEHKVLQWLLGQKNKGTLKEGSVVVYGLDADLILLCLIAGDKLGSQYPIFLLREAMAFGKLVRHDCANSTNSTNGSKGEVDLCFFQISTLRDSLQEKGPRGQWTKEQFYDYIFGMSFCGNDFLPTGLSLRIRDDGHSILLAGLNDLWSKGLNLVSITTEAKTGILRPNAQGLKAFAYWMSRQEERLILTTIRRKMTARLGEDEAENLPLKEQAEKPMIELRGEQVYLKKGWQSEYCKLAIGEDSLEQRKTRVSDFWRGWCWILDYYQGRRVDLEWVYPAGYPPTWSDLVQHFELPADDWLLSDPLKPQEQLALVLPMSSWGLMLKTPYRDLPSRLPQLWPQGFALESFAKRFGWECEPMIPMFTPGRLRYEALK